jgi:signal peptidase I
MNTIKYLPGFLIVGILVAAFVFQDNLIVPKTYKIPAGSMLPTIYTGDYVVVNRNAYADHPVEKGDIIVFQKPTKKTIDYIKRVVATPGDTVEIRDKKLFLNGTEQVEEFTIFTNSEILPGTVSPKDNFGPKTIPENELFVLGDNRDNSIDSRYFGLVHIELVKGKLMFVYWSWDNINHSIRWERLGKTFH